MSFPTDVFSYRVFRFPVNLKGIVSSVREHPIPAEIHLEQNYTNPFNPTTAIGYELAVRGHVSLKLYDVLGREVATLFDGLAEAGRHFALFDGGSYPRESISAGW